QSAKSAADVAALTPCSSAKRTAFSTVRLPTTESRPVPATCPAIGAPMAPRPMNPTFNICLLSLAILRRSWSVVFKLPVHVSRDRQRSIPPRITGSCGDLSRHHPFDLIPRKLRQDHETFSPTCHRIGCYLFWRHYYKPDPYGVWVPLTSDLGVTRSDQALRLIVTFL